MYCPKCAAQTVPGQRFCRSCGTNIGVIVDAIEGKQRGPIDFETLKSDLRELGSNLRAGFEQFKCTHRLDKPQTAPPPANVPIPGMAELAQDLHKSIKRPGWRRERPRWKRPECRQCSSDGGHVTVISCPMPAAVRRASGEESDGYGGRARGHSRS